MNFRRYYNVHKKGLAQLIIGGLEIYASTHIKDGFGKNVLEGLGESNFLFGAFRSFALTEYRRERHGFIKMPICNEVFFVTHIPSFYQINEVTWGKRVRTLVENIIENYSLPSNYI